MDCLKIGGRVEAECDAALVGDYDYTQSCVIEAGNCLRDSGQDVKVGP